MQKITNLKFQKNNNSFEIRKILFNKINNIPNGRSR